MLPEKLSPSKDSAMATIEKPQNSSQINMALYEPK